MFSGVPLYFLERRLHYSYVDIKQQKGFWVCFISFISHLTNTLKKYHQRWSSGLKTAHTAFLAVQDSSIGDIVTDWVN